MTPKEWGGDGTEKDTKVSLSINFAHRHRYYYYCLYGYVRDGAPLNIFIRKMFSIRTSSSPIHAGDGYKVFITCSFNIFKCEHDDDYMIICFSDDGERC